MTLKVATHPTLGQVVFGRKRPRARGMRLHLGNYLPRKLPQVPASGDYSAAALPSLRDVYLNNSLGDCVIAGGYHVTGVETGNASGGSPFVATDAQIVADYGAIGGYNPADPSTDQGCDEQTALNYWTQTGFANGTKLAAWAAVDGTDPAQAMAAAYLFENLYFGIELPDAWISPFPSADGFVWDVGTPDPNNGHCVAGVGYDQAKGVCVATWGLLGWITWPAIAALCTSGSGGELYVMLSPDQIAKGQQKAPNGLAWADLLADIGSLGGNPPAPAPAPIPGGVTLAQAQQWASQGLAENWP